MDEEPTKVFASELTVPMPLSASAVRYGEGNVDVNDDATAMKGTLVVFDDSNAASMGTKWSWLIDNVVADDDECSLLSGERIGGNNFSVIFSKFFFCGCVEEDDDKRASLFVILPDIRFLPKLDSKDELLEIALFLTNAFDDDFREEEFDLSGGSTESLSSVSSSSSNAYGSVGVGRIFDVSESFFDAENMEAFSVLDVLKIAFKPETSFDLTTFLFLFVIDDDSNTLGGGSNGLLTLLLFSFTACRFCSSRCRLWEESQFTSIGFSGCCCCCCCFSATELLVFKGFSSESMSVFTIAHSSSWAVGKFVSTGAPLSTDLSIFLSSLFSSLT